MAEGSVAERPTSGTTGEITFTPQEDGRWINAELHVGERSVSDLEIIRFSLRIGAAVVPMDGIGGVGTADDCRNKGYARRLLNETVSRMEKGDAALTMLYGIPNFYPKFGYASAGPNHSFTMEPLPADAPLPDGWSVRPVEVDDIPAIQRLYEAGTSCAVGSVVRQPDGPTWSCLKATANNEREGDECRVLVSPEGKVAAYAWLGKGFWVQTDWSQGEPESLILSEVMADGPASADAALIVCRKWAAEETATANGPAKRVVLSLPPEGWVASAAMHVNSQQRAVFRECADSMARVLNVNRLLSALRPELEHRLQEARHPFRGSLAIRTDIGEATLTINESGVSLTEGEGGPGKRLSVVMPQTMLARLALGAFPPDDLLSRMETPPDDETRDVLSTLFPLRHPHMFIPDRF